MTNKNRPEQNCPPSVKASCPLSWTTVRDPFLVSPALCSVWHCVERTSPPLLTVKQANSVKPVTIVPLDVTTWWRTPETSAQTNKPWSEEQPLKARLSCEASAPFAPA